MKYKQGDVLIYHSKGLLPWLIRKFTKSNWNHVGIIGEVLDYGYMVYEAQKEGLVKSDYTIQYLDKRISEGTIIVKRPKVKLSKVKESCEKYLGTPYGIWTLFQLAWAFKINKNPQNSDGIKRLICSEFVARALYDCSDKKINFEKEYNKKYDFITPDDIYESKQLIGV